MEEREGEQRRVYGREKESKLVYGEKKEKEKRKGRTGTEKFERRDRGIEVYK